MFSLAKKIINSLAISDSNKANELLKKNIYLDYEFNLSLENLKSKVNEINNKQKQIQLLENEIKIKNKEISIRNAEIKDQIQNISNLKNELDLKEKEITSKDFCLKDKDNYLEKIETELKKIKKEVEQYCENINQLKTSVHDGDNELRKLEVLNKDIEQEAKRYKNFLNNEKYLNKDLLNEKNKIIEELNLTELRLNQARSELQAKYEQELYSSKLNVFYKEVLTRIKLSNTKFYGYPYLEIENYDDDGVSQILYMVASKILNSRLECDSIKFAVKISENNVGLSLLDNDGVEEFYYPNLEKKEQLSPEFYEFTSSKWQRHLMAVEALKNFKSAIILTPNLALKIDRIFINTFVEKIINDYTKLPDILRVDIISLKRELRNPDYEHLSIELKNLSYQSYFFPKFEMRISSAELNKFEFSDFPKFEFPLLKNKTKPFDSWFPESVDNFGEKYEIRFNLKSKIIDQSAIKRLPPADQKFVASLILASPSFITYLSKSNTQIERDWGEWLLLTSNVKKLLISIFNSTKTITEQPLTTKNEVKKVRRIAIDGGKKIKSQVAKK